MTLGGVMGDLAQVPIACMYSDDWIKRLWCLSEAADLAALAPAYAHLPVPMLLFQLDETPCGGVGTPDLHTAECGSAEDREKLTRSLACFPHEHPESLFIQYASSALSSAIVCAFS